MPDDDRNARNADQSLFNLRSQLTDEDISAAARNEPLSLRKGHMPNHLGIFTVGSAPGDVPLICGACSRPNWAVVARQSLGNLDAALPQLICVHCKVRGELRKPEPPAPEVQALVDDANSKQ